MIGGDTPPTGVMVIRIWLEPEHAQPLRARLSSTTLDAGSDSGEDVVVTANPEELIAAVRAWVDSFQAAHGGASP